MFISKRGIYTSLGRDICFWYSLDIDWFISFFNRLIFKVDYLSKLIPYYFKICWFCCNSFYLSGSSFYFKSKISMIVHYCHEQLFSLFPLIFWIWFSIFVWSLRNNEEESLDIFLLFMFSIRVFIKATSLNESLFKSSFASLIEN